MRLDAIIRIESYDVIVTNLTNLEGLTKFRNQLSSSEVIHTFAGRAILQGTFDSRRQQTNREWEEKCWGWSGEFQHMTERNLLENLYEWSTWSLVGPSPLYQRTYSLS